MRFDLEYNARSLAPNEVAKSFIPPEPCFSKLFSKNHSLIVGPRGSGKTTLLKMLTVRALQNWQHPDAHEYAQQISFNAAFIPADIAWGKQIEALDEDKSIHLRREAAFVLHCIRGIVRAMREAVDLGRKDAIPTHVAHLAVSMSEYQETNFVNIASVALGLTPLLPSLLGLEIGVETALNSVAREGLDQFSHATLPSLLSTIVTAFNGIIDEPDRRWALLIDELEIAPTKIKKFLLSGVRSFDERIVVKLAMAPYMEDAQFGDSPTSPHALHDFQTVPLTYSNKADASQFTKALMEKTFERLGFETKYLGDLFEPPKEGGFGHRRSSKEGHGKIPAEFESLAEKDDSFADYMKRKGLFDKAYKFTENKVAQDIRKVLPIVIARDFYVRHFRSERGTSHIRPRKSYAAYTGYPTIAEITEGNPRAILTLVTPLAQELHLSALRHEKLLPVSSGSQANAIRRVELLLTSLLQVIPLDVGGFEAGKGLLDFIDQIGVGLEAKLHKGKFRTDYVGSIRLDYDASNDIIKAVGMALNAGALIHVPNPGGSSDNLLRGLTGQRYRLSYALAPRYSLIPTLGEAIWLSSLFRESGNAQLTAAQTSFFDDRRADHD